jgi:hypothetical protein
MMMMPRTRSIASMRVGVGAIAGLGTEPGWAYKVDETFSEAFRTHDEARKAAELAATEQAAPGDATVRRGGRGMKARQLPGGSGTKRG